MDISPPSSPNPDDYSAATTLVPFHHPIPLLRGPLKAGPADNPSSGPYLLAFETPLSWAAAYNSCKALVISQCESGARIGCSISASNKCKPPWWKLLLGLSSNQDFTARAKCEEIEMEACFASARERCRVFAKNKCAPAFKDARIEVKSLDLKAVINWNEVSRLISGICFVDKKGQRVDIWGVDTPWSEFRRKHEVTNVKGRDILDSDEVDIEDYIRNSM